MCSSDLPSPCPTRWRSETKNWWSTTPPSMVILKRTPLYGPNSPPATSSGAANGSWRNTGKCCKQADGQPFILWPVVAQGTRNYADMGNHYCLMYFNNQVGKSLSARPKAQPMAGCLLAAMPLRDSWCPVGAVPPYGWGVALAGKITFLPAQQGPQPSRWRLCRLTDGAYPLRVKPLFLLPSKRKSGSGLRKRKGRPVKIMERYGTTGRWICAVMVSLG